MTTFTSTCWPLDPGYLDGHVEIHIPPSAALTAYLDVDILDSHGVLPETIIAVTDPFVVRFRVELVGDLWRCLTGDWTFDIGFTPIGAGTNFDLADKLPAGVLNLPGWHSCATPNCIEVPYTVPAGTVPAELTGTLYKAGGKVSLTCCDGSRPILNGFKDLEEVEFY